jgi:hypothetical protein
MTFRISAEAATSYSDTLIVYLTPSSSTAYTGQSFLTINSGKVSAGAYVSSSTSSPAGYMG